MDSFCEGAGSSAFTADNELLCHSSVKKNCLETSLVNPTEQLESKMVTGKRNLSPSAGISKHNQLEYSRESCH